jgi:lipoprotein-anchoring transpeptidase ErfK/SrfK
MRDATASFSSWPRRRARASLAIGAAIGLVVAGCGGSSGSRAGQGGGHARTGTAASNVRLSITPASGSRDRQPGRGIKVIATGGRISRVVVRTRGDRVKGKLNAAGTVWHSTWALNVSRRYTVTATGVGSSGQRVTRTSSFRTITPRRTFTARLVEGSHQTYGVGMPIIIYFDQPIRNRRAVEKALEIKTSKPTVGAWYWDGACRLAPECLYFRPRRHWKPHTRVSFTAHLDGVKGAPGVYGNHTLRQSFRIGRALTVVVSTSQHYMNVYRSGKRFAHWPVSSGRPGDDTPNGSYLTIEKGNPVQMTGPGYSISVPWSVRITFSGEYLHDAYWSVGDQGFSNVSHGCVNMSPANAETFYKMTVPGDPVRVKGSPKSGTWDNGWTMWFLSWRRFVRGSAFNKAVRTGPSGSEFVSPRASARPHAPPGASSPSAPSSASSPRNGTA